jgi:Phosphotransferase enzyme family
VPVRTAPAGLTTSDAQLRARYLAEVLTLLYPGSPSAGGELIAEYLVVPDTRRPRLLVPAGSRRVAAAAVRRYAEPQSRAARVKRAAVVAALRTGASRLLLRDRVRVTGPAGDSIDAYLRAALGRELALSIHIGPARANRKPVLQLISPDGETFGFGKLGTGPLTQRLVRAETNALTALGTLGLTRLTVPRVLHAGGWRGLPVLVQSALPVWLPRAPLTPRRLTAAMLDIAGCCGFTAGPLVGGAYWAELRGRLGAVADRPEGGALAAAAERLAARAGDTPLRYGAWHGDWSPWNMASLADTLLVWDWERFCTGVPVGFDAVHHELQRRIQSTPDAASAVEATVRGCGALLAPFGVEPGARELTALLYLVDLAVRYLTDRQAEAGARLGVLGTWLLPVLIRRVEEL